MSTIPLKKADLSDFFWDHDVGPFENIFKWANRGLMLFGGPIGLVAMGLTALGYDLSDLGRMIDKAFDVHSLSDAANLNPLEISSHLTDMLWPKIQPISVEQSNNNIGFGKVGGILTKATLGVGLTGMLSWIFKGPLMMLLKGTGAITAEQIGKGQQSRHKEVSKTESPSTPNFQANLEKAIDKIFQ